MKTTAWLPEGVPADVTAWPLVAIETWDRVTQRRTWVVQRGDMAYELQSVHDGRTAAWSRSSSGSTEYARATGTCGTGRRGTVDPEQILGLAEAFAEWRSHMEETRRAFAAYGAVFEAHLAQTYRDEVGRVPGSARTKRLRKKRRTALFAWWAAEVDKGGAGGGE